MPSLGGGELLLIAVVVLIVFGAGKIPQTLGQLGKGVRDFRAASEGKETSSASAGKAPTATGRACGSCGAALAADANFCTRCGARAAG